MPQLRWAEPQDVESIARLLRRCFPEATTPDCVERLRNDPRCQISDILIAEEGGRVAGSATVLPQSLWTGGAEHPQGGVASVQVDHDFRRRGIAQMLMRRLLEAHGERGFGLSMLYPYDPAFYRRLGYATIERWLQLRLRTSSLPDCPAALSVRTAQDADLEAIFCCHRESLPIHNGGMTRSPAVWRTNILSAPRLMAVFENRRGIQGYLFYELKPTHDGLQQILHVREWVALENEAEAALLGYLRHQKAQCPETHLIAPINWPLPLFLCEPRSATYENPGCGRYTSGTMGTGAMARVVRLIDLFAARRAFRGPALSCRFVVTEAAALKPPGSEGLRQETVVEFDGEAAHAASGNPRAWLECDPGTMAQIYLGAASPSEAAYWGAARADSPQTLETLDRLFAQSPPFIHPLDYF